METPGGYLKREREMRGISLEEVAGAIKLSVKVLEALESNRYDELPHPVYIKGFIRAYARYLGLDENDAVLRFEVYLKDLKEEQPPEHRATTQHYPLGEEPEGSKKPYMVAVVSVVLGLVVIALYLLLSSGTSPEKKEGLEGGKLSALEKKPSATKKPTPKEQKKPSVKEPKRAGVEKKPAPFFKAKEEAPEATKPRRVAKPLPTPPTSEPKKAEARTPEATTPSKEAQLPAAVKPQRVEPAAGPYSLDIYAKETTWIKAEIDGKEPFEVLLREGEHITWKAERVFF